MENKAAQGSAKINSFLVLQKKHRLFLLFIKTTGITLGVF
jgi:hypothetical protein